MDEKTLARFWSKVEKTEGCWLWRGLLNRQGYGYTSRSKGSRLAHRVAWAIHHGSEPDKCVLHRCDVPTCVNPEHLFEGSRTDNHNDKMAKGRNVNPPVHFGSAHPQAKLTEGDIPLIRAELANGRSCKRVADMFGVSKKTILNIKHGRIWVQVPSHHFASHPWTIWEQYSRAPGSHVIASSFNATEHAT